MAQVVSTLFPRSLRLMVKTQIDSVKQKLVSKVKGLVGLGPKPVSTSAAQQ
jgi:hypothetical protein